MSTNALPDVRVRARLGGGGSNFHKPAAHAAERLLRELVARAPYNDDDTGVDNVVDTSVSQREVGGDRPLREGLLSTPQRVARSLEFLLGGYNLSPAEVVGQALFNEPELQTHAVDDLVVVSNIAFFSLHRATFRPFGGQLHVGYRPRDGTIVGLSKLVRIAHMYARRLQTPETLAEDIADGFDSVVRPRQLALMIEGFSVNCDGVAAHGRAVAVRGCQNGADHSRLVDEFQSIVAIQQLTSQGPVPTSSCACGNIPQTNGVSPITACEPRRETATHESNGADGTTKMAGAPMRQAAADLLSAIGFSQSRLDAEGIGHAPNALANSLAAATTGGGYRSLEDAALACTISTQRAKHGKEVAEFCLPFASLCEHHLLPFYGTVYVAIYGGDALRASLATVGRVVSMFSKRLQVQERLTRQLAVALSRVLDLEAAMGVSSSRRSGGVVVVVSAAHTCMMARGVRNTPSRTTTVSSTGQLEMDQRLRQEIVTRLLQGDFTVATVPTAAVSQ